MPPPAASTTASTQMCTRFTIQFGCRIPIMGAPMAGVSGGLLAAATCRAGALGFIGAGHLSDPSALREQVGLFRANVPDGTPLNIGFIGYSSMKDGLDKVAEAIKEHRPMAVQFFAPAIVEGGENVKLAQSLGSLVVAQIGSEHAAREALLAGVDCVVVQGREAGGHGLRAEFGRSTFPLAARVLQLIRSEAGCNKDVTVLAAGGIVDGRGLAAALALGCDGAVFGTRLWATHEAVGKEAFKYALTTACTDDVIRTTVFDQIQNSYSSFPWPHPFDSVGALDNLTTREWEGRAGELADVLLQQDAAVAREYRKALDEGIASRAAVLAGEGVGCIDTIESAEAVVRRAEGEAIAQIEQMHRYMLIPRQT
mmetsp:Transcript_33012/g.72550  ORF Transcript_33012/g.72550 Transcript_33012/m.72550 type:complete len:368 (+) Transcript_33012:185-1288(+)